MTRRPLEAWQVSVLLILAFRGLGAKKPTGVSRSKFSRRTLAKVSRRAVLRDAFIDDVRLELADRGFILLDRREGFALIDAASVDSWATMTSKLISKELTDVRADAFDFGKADERLEHGDEDDDE